MRRPSRLLLPLSRRCFPLGGDRSCGYFGTIFAFYSSRVDRTHDVPVGGAVCQAGVDMGGISDSGVLGYTGQGTIGGICTVHPVFIGIGCRVPG